MEVAPETSWLSAPETGVLTALGTARSVPSGSTLFVEGDEPYDLMVIESGDVKLTTTSLTGQEVVLDVVGAGEMLGELSAIDGSRRSATAVALNDVRLTSIGVERFLAFLQEHPPAMGALLAIVIRRLRSSNRRQLEFSTTDSLGRVCARLDELAARYGRADGDDAVAIELEINQTELAQWCGLSREAIVKALRKLRNLGWVDTSAGTITLNDRDQIAIRGQL
ncbi:MAG: Crp/Fnr family transcriptional regulator [Ilumatobacter sp.]|uniref:Crp/Fnr family transcriptional regulator n=1 Tax=Ilumatobacter sp. TaxID=1967498 RepID=UPI00262B883F|nr:Crp/Fnr family transcriptional regulator [Ilumatobacter sp.]MDJ0767971.1 Crp/Fnr family transcriptional regulator [Ilumatobacter sp.]